MYISLYTQISVYRLQILYTPPFPPCLKDTVYIYKMKNKSSKIGKNEVVNVSFSLIVTIIAYLAINYFNPPIENLLYPVIFILMLIYLELLNKK